MTAILPINAKKSYYLVGVFRGKSSSLLKRPPNEKPCYRGHNEIQTFLFFGNFEEIVLLLMQIVGPIGSRLEIH